jgi:elongation factor P
MATANDIRRGMAINYNGDIAVVLDSQHRTPGNLRAFVQASIRSIRTGKSSDVRFSSTEKIEVVPMQTRKWSSATRTATITFSPIPRLTRR